MLRIQALSLDELFNCLIRRLVSHFFVLPTLWCHTVYLELNRQPQNLIYLLSIYWDSVGISFDSIIVEGSKSVKGFTICWLFVPNETNCIFCIWLFLALSHRIKLCIAIISVAQPIPVSYDWLVKWIELNILRLRKHWDSRENKTNYFLREQTLSVYIISRNLASFSKKQQMLWIVVTTINKIYRDLLTSLAIQ
jgi:hypothetical protein